MRAVLPVLRRRLVEFARDERGVISAEAVIITPTLIFTFLALFAFWHAFRAETTTIRATYTVADMISRENESVNDAFITGMYRVYSHMVATSEPTWMRVSSIRYDGVNNRYTVLWSRSTQPSRAPRFTNATINDVRDRLPLPAHDDTLLVVESWRTYTPVFRHFWFVPGPSEPGVLSSGVFHEFSVVRSRFVSPLLII